MTDLAVDDHGGQVLDAHLFAAGHVLTLGELVLDDVLDLVAEELLGGVGRGHHVGAGRALLGVQSEALDEGLLQVGVVGHLHHDVVEANNLCFYN